MELECNKCGYEWDYQGQSDYYATCPNCHYKVKITAKAKVVDSENKQKVNIPAKAQVFSPNDNATFDEKERDFIEEIKQTDNKQEIKEVFKKYDQEEFNILNKKIKEKANTIKNDLNQFEKVEEVLEDLNWEYPDL